MDHSDGDDPHSCEGPTQYPLWWKMPDALSETETDLLMAVIRY